jgi:hypothetical protein
MRSGLESDAPVLKLRFGAYRDTAAGDFAPPESFKTFLQRFTSADAEEVDVGILHY